MGSTRLLSSEEIKSELLKGVKDLWESSLFFDFTLKVEDEDIPVHKFILAVCSGYFRAMFNSSMKESTQTSVELKGLTANAVKSVINFIYTGDIELSADTLEDVLSAAHYLQIASAVSLCCDYLLEDITWDSVSYVQNFARMYGLDDVEKEVEEFMLDYFFEMPDKAVESVGKQVLKLIGSNKLCVKSEYALFERLLSFKSILSDDEFYEALSQVRFPLMSKDELEKVSSTGLMITRLSHLMDEAREYHKDVMRQPLLQTERTQVRSDKVAMVMADNNSFTGVYKDQPAKTIKTREPIEPENILGGCRIRESVAVDNYLYVCQERSHRSDYLEFFRYDPRFNSWQELEPHTNKVWFSLVVYGKKIFSIGGQYSPRTVTMEIYDIQTNEWRSGVNINYNGLHSAAGSLGDKVYVCGGQIVQEPDGPLYDEDCFDILSCYDPESDTWEFKAPMVEARYKHKSLAFDGKLFVFGGTDGERSLFSIEYYSPDVNQWTIFHNDLPYDVIDGVCSNGSDIYILKRNERTNKIDPSMMTVSFDKFNVETGNTEEGGLFIEVQKYNENYIWINPNFKCATMMLPFKFR